MQKRSVGSERSRTSAPGPSLYRRRFVGTAGMVCLVGLAGCMGDRPDDESADSGGESDGSEGGQSSGGNESGGDGESGGSNRSDEMETGGTGSGPYTLTVTVEDEAGEPIPGARVEVDPFDEPDETADSDGRIVFELRNGEYLVEAEAEGFESAETTVTIDGADEAVTLTLPADD
ncbi:carboxypeptidase-like regulatory domain-containing protein [Halalkalicoccus sp. NIPERK01]|uniref:carboxypeptidase-like regulatory domain-containing protein n=1 Tax=Halalkalicoccus sp. NIPERK01 TaxID=3053469 RepID=UPI00256ECB3C|nr:carboxypeptidase-like regulatory domain-containing protein [Halalkalicoccus sp. NIPERK01]MDL5362191.1 carboxypeptidase-like regulatory domain-containing protein [Halalkalicoccus sp. NIPERK01]